MKVTEHLAGAARCLFSFEVLPPKKGETVDGIFQTVEALLPYKPAFVDVTSHATEVLYKDLGGGMLKRIPVKKRPGTLSVCAAVKYRYGLDTVPHLICSGFSKEETEDALIELGFLGIENVMALRGDPSHGAKRFVPEPGGHAYALNLVEQISAMNRGEYLHEGTDLSPTSFCVGVAGYPEKHMEAPNRSADLKHLKAKLDAGGSFIVTQMFFDNSHYFRFVDECRAAGITAPIIPGLKPLTARAQLAVLPQTFRIDLPDALVERTEKCASPSAVRQLGVEWCIEQSRELMARGAPCLHYYTMGKAQSVREVAEAVFGSRAG